LYDEETPMYDDGRLDEEEAAPPAPAETASKASQDAENGDIVAEAAPIGGSFGFGGTDSMPSSFGIGQPSASASASSHLPSAGGGDGVETDAYSTHIAAYSSTTNNRHSAYGSNPSYAAPSDTLFTSEQALPPYPTSTTYATTHHGQSNNFDNQQRPSSIITNWNDAAVAVPSAFPLNPAKFDPPYSPMDPYASTQFNTSIFGGHHSQAAYANTSGVYATSGHPGFPAQLSMESTVDGHGGGGTNPIQPVAHTQQKVKVQDREGRTRIYEIDSGEHPEWKVRPFYGPWQIG